MASETDTQTAETSSVPDMSLRNRHIYLFLPFLLGFSNRENETQQRSNQESLENSDNSNTDNLSRERIVLVNPFTQGMVVIEGASSLDPLLRSLASDQTAAKDGQPPASKASIDAMPRVEIVERNDDRQGVCAICLEEWMLGDVAREMPCKHRFHGKCIEEWLGFHGTCPVCRYKMPVDETEIEKKRSNEQREILISFRFSGDGDRENGDSDQSSSSLQVSQG